jgi:hypothetical protein
MLPFSATAKTTLPFGTLVIAALSLVFAVGSIVANQKAYAANLCGSGFCEPDVGISYPSPLSSFFGGDVLDHGFHHWRSSFGAYSHGGFHHHH